MIAVVLNDQVAVVTACAVAGPIPKLLVLIEAQTAQNDIEEQV